MRTVGVIGGSGLYEMPGLAGVEEVQVQTPFGAPSDAYFVGRLGNVRLIFLPRHGRGHRILPSELNFRANIFGMKTLGADTILAIGAVGSLREEIRPGDLVVADQFIDRTFQRPSTFFGNGIVAHVMFADPVCPSLCDTVYAAAQAQGASVHKGGTYVCMEGPQFSTRAESHLYRQWGAHVIGMTNLQEAKLAREAEMCFATLALATDYDCWHATEDDVAIEDILRVLSQNVVMAQKVIAAAVAMLPAMRVCACGSALANAIITDRSRIPASVKKDLEPIIGKYM